MRPGDVITEVDGSPVADDGSIKIGDARVTFEHLLDMKQAGEPVSLRVWRAGEEKELTAVSRHIARLESRRNRYGVAPRYVVYAGLVFMPLDTELLKTYGRGWPQSADRNLVWHLLYREAEQPETAEREVVVLHYLEGYRCEEIAQILGAPVGRVRHRLVEARARLRRELGGEESGNRGGKRR